ncbi:N-acetylneuraminate lyase [Yersinia enterocolitica]|nr:N-acetylneuraminate lyase [Yersinia enterocolitica]
MSLVLKTILANHAPTLSDLLRMRMKKLTGLIAAPHTPFDEQGEVNYPVIDQIAEHLVNDGVKGVYVCGTTGEGIHCSVEERKKIAERWVKAAQGKLSITLHTGALSIKDAVDLSRHAETLDIFATSAIGPCFFKPGNIDDLIAYCQAIAAAAPSKGFYYYHSGMSGVNLDMEQFLIKAESKIPNLSGIKFNNADLYEFQRCLRVSGGKFDIPFGSMNIYRVVWQWELLAQSAVLIITPRRYSIKSLLILMLAIKLPYNAVWIRLLLLFAFWSNLVALLPVKLQCNYTVLMPVIHACHYVR